MDSSGTVTNALLRVHQAKYQSTVSANAQPTPISSTVNADPHLNVLTISNGTVRPASPFHALLVTSGMAINVRLMLKTVQLGPTTMASRVSPSPIIARLALGGTDRSVSPIQRNAQLAPTGQDQLVRLFPHSAHQRCTGSMDNASRLETSALQEPTSTDKAASLTRRAPMAEYGTKLSHSASAQVIHSGTATSASNVAVDKSTKALAVSAL